jgi:alkylation response protein AidB-like acyl-CoA dehydrogenase
MGRYCALHAGDCRNPPCSRRRRFFRRPSVSDAPSSPVVLARYVRGAGPLHRWLDAQRAKVTEFALAGIWWGTITSEPGSGGDVGMTRAVARSDGNWAWRLSGQKHFGSGSGIASFMITTAMPEGEQEPDWFYVDMRGRAWDGSAGVRLIAPWDGHGMQATQSHSIAFDGVPAIRIAWPGNWKLLADAAGPFIGSIFTAVILGIVDAAVDSARQDLAPKKDSLRAYERVEWTRAEMEAWLAVQAYEGMLRAVETETSPLLSVIRGKTAVSELAESVLRRVCRVMGGGTFVRRGASPLTLSTTRDGP